MTLLGLGRRLGALAASGHKKAPECVIGGYALRSSFWGRRFPPANTSLLAGKGSAPPPRITTFALLFRGWILPRQHRELRGFERRNSRRNRLHGRVSGRATDQDGPVLVVAEPVTHRPVKRLRDPVRPAALGRAHDDHRRVGLGRSLPSARAGSPGKCAQRPLRGRPGPDCGADDGSRPSVTDRMSSSSLSGCSERRWADRAGSHSTR